MEDFRKALAYLIQYLRQSNSPPLDRLLSWKSVAKLNVETQDWGKGAMYVAEYLDILPKAILRSDSSYDFQRILSKLSGLGAWTASVFLRAEKSALESLQAVEKCREIYFSLIIDFRSDVSLLKSCCPDLWSRYSCLREAVAALTFSPRGTSFASKLSSVENYTIMSLQRTEDVEKLDEIESEIRNQPGFERFQLPPTESQRQSFII